MGDDGIICIHSDLGIIKYELKVIDIHQKKKRSKARPLGNTIPNTFNIRYVPNELTALFSAT